MVIAMTLDADFLDGKKKVQERQSSVKTTWNPIHLVLGT